MVDSGLEFFTQYRNISAKLKKRFLRKPNVSEASEQFGALVKQLEQQELPHYAGFCSLAVARCEQTLGNHPGETQALVQAAHYFLQAEQDEHELHCPSFKENIEAAKSCYHHAIKNYIEQGQNVLASALCLELATALRKFGCKLEALSNYQRAADLQAQSPMEFMNTMNLITSLKIELGDYDGALNAVSRVHQLAIELSAPDEPAAGEEDTVAPPVIGVFADIISEAEVTCLLLLLLLRPSAQRLRSQHAQLLEKYVWGPKDMENGNFLNDEMFLLLQSLLLSCQSRDVKGLRPLQTDLWRHLTAEQNQLVHLLIKDISESIL